jgi:hypothetical protein
MEYLSLTQTKSHAPLKFKRDIGYFEKCGVAGTGTNDIVRITDFSINNLALSTTDGSSAWMKIDVVLYGYILRLSTKFYDAWFNEAGQWFVAMFHSFCCNFNNLIFLKNAMVRGYLRDY